MEWSISTLRDAAGDARFHVAVQRDVTTFRRLLANAERQARTDPLTGLDNRRAFDARLTAVLANRRVRDRVGLIALDIDHFKSVNDAHGHATGDLVLQEVARRVRRAVGRRGTVARTGGEEMAVILVDAPDLTAVADLAERVRVAIAASPVEVVSGRLPVTASLGVAHATAGGRGAEALAACADRALYRSKADGRNRVTSAMPWTEAHARAS
jgi:diguanylate cyclase (GGDEF)-like protein